MGRGSKALVRVLGAALLGLSSLAGSARAQTEAPKAVVVTALNVSGSHEQPARTAALAGDTLRMEIAFTNVSGRAAKNVTFADPLPGSLTLIGGSVGTSVPARVEYSTDGGKTYSAEEPAPEAVTDVRWTVTGAVAPGARVTAHFLARVAPRGSK